MFNEFIGSHIDGVVHDARVAIEIDTAGNRRVVPGIHAGRGALEVVVPVGYKLRVGGDVSVRSLRYVWRAGMVGGCADKVIIADSGSIPPNNAVVGRAGGHSASSMGLISVNGTAVGRAVVYPAAISIRLIIAEDAIVGRAASHSAAIIGRCVFVEDTMIGRAAVHPAAIIGRRVSTKSAVAGCAVQHSAAILGCRISAKGTVDGITTVHPAAILGLISAEGAVDGCALDHPATRTRITGIIGNNTVRYHWIRTPTEDSSPTFGDGEAGERAIAHFDPLAVAAACSCFFAFDDCHLGAIHGADDDVFFDDHPRF